LVLGTAFDALIRRTRLLDDPDIETINSNGCDQAWARYADAPSVRRS
jgi:hypothetical protein